LQRHDLILQANSLIAALILELLQFPPAVEIGEEKVTVPLSSALPMEVVVALSSKLPMAVAVALSSELLLLFCLRFLCNLFS